MPAAGKLKPRKKPHQQRARATVDAILEAAAQVFEREGYDGTTTDRIADRAGVSVGSLYQYFPSKDAILVMLAERHVERAVDRVRRLVGDAGGFEALAHVEVEDVLRALIGEVAAMHRDQPRLHRILFVESPIPEEHHARIEDLEHGLVEMAAMLLRAHPRVTSPDPDLSAWMLVHAVHGLVHDFVVHPPRADRSEAAFVDDLVRMLAGYLCGPAERT